MNKYTKTAQSLITAVINIHTFDSEVLNMESRLRYSGVCSRYLRHTAVKSSFTMFGFNGRRPQRQMYFSPKQFTGL